MQIFDIIFKNICLENEEMNKILDKILLSLVTRATIIIGEHYEQQLWCDETSRKYSHTLLQQIVDTCKCNSVSEMLCGAESLHFIPNGVFLCVAATLKPRVNQSRWKQNPSAMCAWQWCIMNTKWPFISDHIHIMLPAALCLTDDFQAENKIRGVQCLAHILEHATAGALQCYGRGELIYQALQHQLYVRDVRLLEELLPALVVCLRILEGSSWSEQCPEKENRSDTRPHFNVKTVFLGIGISIIKIKWSWECLIFVMEILIHVHDVLVRCFLIIEAAPRSFEIFS